ncbi:portal vertex protein [uncultured Caudovirales phage]|uniref:Portal vertex protein n=1 Tax=uncultured Caudovirales phage TaxID=2100421 RepID=A0A6J5NJX4_9CAUD|nr:portal vertex protein [uncultured Caudovirales phage]
MKEFNPNAKFFAFNAPVIDPTLPKIFESRGQSWVWYGNDNLFPNLQVTPLYNGSAINRSCITSKHIYTIGEGLETKNKDLEYVLKRANETEGWNDIFAKAALDYILYGGLCLNIIWNQLGDKIVDMYHVDFNTVRSGHIDRETDKVEWYYYSADWGRYKKDIYRPKAFKSFSPSQADLYPNQLLYFFDHSPSNIFYPVPSYSGSLTDISLDISVASFHYYNLQNGLSPSLFISMNNGIPAPEERQDIYQELASSFSGVENVGKFFLSFSDSKENGTEITPIDSANDDYYLTLENRITSRILTGHRITSPLLLGIKDSGGSSLSNNKDEILVASNHFNATVIKPIQKVLLKVFDRLLHYYGYDTDLYIKPLNLFDEDNQQIGEATVDAQV